MKSKNQETELKVNYSREERYKLTHFHHDDPTLKNGAKKGRQILLLDLAFIFIIGAFLYPFMVTQYRTVRQNGFVLTYRPIHPKEGTTLLWLIKPSRKVDINQDIFTLVIKDNEDLVLEEWSDLLPEKKQTRQFRFLVSGEEKIPLFLEWEVGDKTIRRQLMLPGNLKK